MSGRKNIPETKNGMSTVHCNNSGFTLIETVIALLVLTIGLLGMASLAISVMQGNKSSNQISTATALAQDKMEELRGLGYKDLPGSDSTVTENSVSGFPKYKRVVVTDVDWPAQFMKKVTVTVYWDSDKHSVENKMIISR